MSRFTAVKLNDEIYSLVFGYGKVIFVLAKGLRVDGYFIFEVEYQNGQKVHYTEDGRPNWCRDINNCTKTICYKSEVDFDTLDTKKKNKTLPKHKIEKFREKDKLEMMSPAGGWIDVNLMPDIMVDNALNNGEFDLFRKMKKKEDSNTN